jgi:hypothetical protein
MPAMEVTVGSFRQWTLNPLTLPLTTATPFVMANPVSEQVLGLFAETEGWIFKLVKRASPKAQLRVPKAAMITMSVRWILCSAIEACVT